MVWGVTEVQWGAGAILAGAQPELHHGGGTPPKRTLFRGIYFAKRALFKEFYLKKNTSGPMGGRRAPPWLRNCLLAPLDPPLASGAESAE